MDDQPDKIKDPGTAPYGNFINYYAFNSAEDRIKLLPPNLWLDNHDKELQDAYVVLDVGCNAGNLTQLLYKFLKEQTSRDVFILGIDIDAELIKRAEEHNEYPQNVQYKCMDVMEPRVGDENCLPKFLESFGKIKFNAVFCLSITMWIHLNHGDDGLMRFLNEIQRHTSMLVIEPQPWKCYGAAVRRLRKVGKEFDKFAGLKVRKTVESDICRYLQVECNLEKIFETIPTKWARKIAFYKEKRI